MSPRESLLSVLRREGMPDVPFDISLCPSQQERFRRETGSSDVAAWFRLSHRSVPATLAGAPNPKALHRTALPEGTTFDAWGVGHSPGSAAAAHMTKLEIPLAGEIDLHDVTAYPMPKVADVEALERRVATIHESGFAVAGGLSQTIWETAWAIRGMEDLMVDMLTGDEKATTLLDRVTEVAVIRARLYARSGCDIIQLGDDIGMQSTPLMSVDLWREWLKPRLARVIDAARAEHPKVLIFYHSCGYVEPFIDDLIDVGIEILNPVQPECMSFADLHERYSSRLSFWGTIGTQTTMPFGTPEDVREEVLRNVKLCDDRGGLVIAPTHLVEPEVPWENIVALREACDAAL